ncbi:neutral zinc metallopeptidase, partial [Candidatus Kaiserbacteria bacterium]|nr:neutral zinc metallopeptidase [Candidatus Kaiserbacteria bacterium]
FDELKNRLGGSNDDVAQAYVIAHEVGHHVQNLLGELGTSRSNEASIATELQADCYAGLWAASIKDQQVLQPGEIQEALDAAAAVGDDHIQEITQGSIHKESWTHGSSAERVAAFTKGYDSGDFAACQ